jgi:hypothetical protein
MARQGTTRLGEQKKGKARDGKTTQRKEGKGNAMLGNSRKCNATHGKVR